MSLVSAPWSAKAKPQAWRSMWGWASSGRAAALLYVRKSRLTVERCRGLRRSLRKNAFTLAGAFLRARSFSQAPPSARRRAHMQHAAFGVHLVEFQPAGLRHAQPMPEHQQPQAAVVRGDPV